MATSRAKFSQQFSSKISSKISKWVLRATAQVKEKNTNPSSNIGNQSNCQVSKSGRSSAPDEQRNKSVALSKQNMSSGRTRQRKLSISTPPTFEKIAEHPRATRKMSAPCSPRSFEVDQECKTLKRNAYSGDDIAELKYEESDRRHFFNARTFQKRRSNSEIEERVLNSNDVIDREINNNDNYSDVKEPRECGKLNFIDINEQDARKQLVNSSGDTSLYNKHSINNVKKVNRTLSDQAHQTVYENKGRNSSFAESQSSSPFSNHIRNEDLAMPVLSQQISARLQRWVESATQRTISRQRKYSEDSVSSSSSNNESIFLGSQRDYGSLRTKNEPANPSEIKELELAIKELVTGVGSKGFLKSETEKRNFTRSRETSVSQNSDCSDSISRLSDFRFDDFKDGTAGKEETTVFSDNRIISKAGSTNDASIEENTTKSLHNEETLCYHQARETEKYDDFCSFQGMSQNKTINDKASEFEDINYANFSSFKEINTSEQQVNKSGMTKHNNTKEAISGKMCFNENEFKGNKVPAVVKSTSICRETRQTEKESQSLDTSPWERSTSNTNDDEKSCPEEQRMKSSKKTPPPRPPRPNFKKRYTAPNSEGLKVRDKAKRDSLPAIWDFKDEALEQFAQACVRQANKKEKRLAKQKRENSSENDKLDSCSGSYDIKHERSNSLSEPSKFESKRVKEKLVEKPSKGNSLLSTPSKSMSSLYIRQESLDEQKIVEDNASNDENLNHYFENINDESFKHDEENSHKVFETLSKSKKETSTKTSRLYKFPSLPMFYWPKSSKTTTVSEKSKALKLTNGRRRSGTVSSASDLRETLASSMTSDPFYHSEELNSSVLRTTTSTDSLFTDNSGNVTSANQRETSSKIEETHSNQQVRRRNASTPCMPFPYVEELV